jgi:hypothetical protein
MKASPAKIVLGLTGRADEESYHGIERPVLFTAPADGNFI